MSQAQAVETKNWFRGAIQGKTRIALAWILSIILIFSAREYPNLPGIFLCFLGATLRFWAGGYLRKDSSLAVGGPYGMTRNPLYFGTYLMALGAALAIENWILLIAITVLFGVIYHFIILDEETKLRKFFGARYDQWCEWVPRFIPRPWPYSQNKLKTLNNSPDAFRFDWSLGWTKNKGYEAYAAFLALIGILALVAHIWKNFL